MYMGISKGYKLYTYIVLYQVHILKKEMFAVDAMVKLRTKQSKMKASRKSNQFRHLKPLDTYLQSCILKKQLGAF